MKNIEAKQLEPVRKALMEILETNSECVNTSRRHYEGKDDMYGTPLQIINPVNQVGKLADEALNTLGRITGKNVFHIFE